MEDREGLGHWTSGHCSVRGFVPSLRQEIAKGLKGHIGGERRSGIMRLTETR